MRTTFFPLSQRCAYPRYSSPSSPAAVPCLRPALPCPRPNGLYKALSRDSALYPRMLPVVCTVSSDGLFGPSMIQTVVVRSHGSIGTRLRVAVRIPAGLAVCRDVWWHTGLTFSVLFPEDVESQRFAHYQSLQKSTFSDGSACLDSFLHQMFCLRHVNMFSRPKTLLPSQKPRAHLKFDSTSFCTMASSSPAAGAN